MKKVVLLLLNFLILLPIFALVTPSVTEAGDKMMWYFYSNNNANLDWEVGFRSIDDYRQAGQSYNTMRYTWVDSTLCGTGIQCRSGVFDLNEQRPYALQWGTSCVDPIVDTTIVGPGPYNDPSNTYYTTGWINVTKNHRGIDWFEANGGGNISFGSSFSDTSNCPVVPTPSMTSVSITTNCTTANEPRIRASWNDVSYADYYDIQRRHYDGSAWTSWTSSDTLNDDGSASFASSYIVGSENTLYQIRVRAHTIAYVGGPTAWDSSPSIRTLICTPTTNKYRCNGASCIQDNTNGTFTTSNCNNTCSSPTCDFTTPERRMVDGCTYQTCQSPSPGSWGPNQICPPNSRLVAVANAFKYSCQASAGSCTNPTCTYSQCEGSPLACVSHTQNAPCPATDCTACSGSACF